MKFSELPKDIQDRLLKEKANLCKRNINTPYEVSLYSKKGSYYFKARRVVESWSDDKGNYMPFGGGSFWTIRIGKVNLARVKQVMGYDYEFVDGETFSKAVIDGETCLIPSKVKTKKEVVNIVSKLSRFFEI